MTYRTDFRQKITSNYSRTLGSKLAKQAVRLGVPVANIAYATNLSRQTIYNWFSGKNEPAKYHIPRIKEILGL